MTFFILGLAVGLLSTVFGIGGGIIMVPALTAFLGFSQVEAMATSLGTIFLITTWNSWRYSRQKLINWRTVLMVAVVSASASALASRTAPMLPEKVLFAIMVSVLLLLAWRTFKLSHEKNSTAPSSTRIPHIVGIGSLSGLIAGFTGIGGGGVTTPLMLISGLVDNRGAAPTSNAIMIFTAGAGTLTYALQESLAWPRIGLIHGDLVIQLSLGALLSSFLGIRINRIMPLKWRKLILGLILLIVTTRYLFLMLS